MGVSPQSTLVRTRIMGVLNATPDSFYRPSRVSTAADAASRAREMIAAGADIVDIGGESSRPGSDPVTAEEEWARVAPVLDAIKPLGARVSIDTWRASTAARAIACGVTMVNDITALRGDPEMAGVVASSGTDCVLMHMLGTPKTMQRAPAYADVVDDIRAFFEERAAYAMSQGIGESKIWIDPGIGFGKTVAHNLELIRRLGEFQALGFPILVGTSNKSTIGAVLDLPPEDRGEGTAATVAIAVWNGAACVRVHEVQAMARVVRMTEAIMGKTAHG